MARTPFVWLLAAVPLLLSTRAQAFVDEEMRLDHRNQPSILTGLSFEQLLVSGRGEGKENPKVPGGLFDLSVGMPLNEDGGEGFVGLRLGGGEGGTRVVAPYVFYRGYAGFDEWKTFFDAGVFLRIEPLVAVGGRLGVGVQYDFTEHLGTFVGAGVGLGYGQGLQVSPDLGAGLQIRFGTPG